MRERTSTLLVVMLLVTGCPAGGAEPPAGDDPLRMPRQTESAPPWGIVVSGLGLTAGIGLGLALKDAADERYDRYLRTADPDQARRWLDSAQRYDRSTLIGWSVAQVSFVALFYCLTRDRERPLVPIEGEPILEMQGDGVRVGLRVAP